MTARVAFRCNQRTAMDRRTTMRAVAEAVLAAGFDLTADSGR
jgi:AmiR/NasT family two-component response regulator